MPELIAKANQAILESQMLRRERRALRFEATTRASELGRTIIQSQREDRAAVDGLKTSLEQVFSKP